MLRIDSLTEKTIHHSINHDITLHTSKHNTIIIHTYNYI